MEKNGEMGQKIGSKKNYQYQYQYQCQFQHQDQDQHHHKEKNTKNIETICQNKNEDYSILSHLNSALLDR